MSQPTFSQSERRSYLAPILIAVAVLIVIGIAGWLYFPHRIADIVVTHTTAVPTHIEMATGSKLVGHETETEDDLYVLLTLHIDNKLHDPLFLSDITTSLTTASDAVVSTSAIEKNDLDATYTAFPQVKSAATSPLLRESTIQPGGHAEGMIILHFPLTQADWNSRKSATLAVTFYHQPPITILIPTNN